MSRENLEHSLLLQVNAYNTGTFNYKLDSRKTFMKQECFNDINWDVYVSILCLGRLIDGLGKNSVKLEFQIREMRSSFNNLRGIFSKMVKADFWKGILNSEVNSVMNAYQRHVITRNEASSYLHSLRKFAELKLKHVVRLAVEISRTIIDIEYSKGIPAPIDVVVKGIVEKIPKNLPSRPLPPMKKEFGKLNLLTEKAFESPIKAINGLIDFHKKGVVILRENLHSSIDETRSFAKSRFNHVIRRDEIFKSTIILPNGLQHSRLGGV